MDRRTALKNLTMSIGYAIATPTILNVLSSCTSEMATWTPLFLSKEEQKIVTQLTDIIFPVSDTPGALDVNVPQFIDLMYKDIEGETKQKQFKKGAAIVADKFLEMFGTTIMEGEKEQFKKLLSVYFDIPKSETERILKEQNLKAHELKRTQVEEYAVYKFLMSVRYYTIFGYVTSEKVGEEVLNYDPIPGSYEGCLPMSEIENGHAWSLR